LTYIWKVSTSQKSQRKSVWLGQGIDKVTQQIESFQFVAELNKNDEDEPTPTELADFSEPDFAFPHIKKNNRRRSAFACRIYRRLIYICRMGGIKNHPDFALRGHQTPQNCLGCQCIHDDAEGLRMTHADVHQTLNRDTDQAGSGERERINRNVHYSEIRDNQIGPVAKDNGRTNSAA
jgi:hypothetical protein